MYLSNVKKRKINLAKSHGNRMDLYVNAASLVRTIVVYQQQLVLQTPLHIKKPIIGEKIVFQLLSMNQELICIVCKICLYL